ncbi:MAG: glycosyltransferase [Ignavibacteria bacterium]|jgi:spore maturation protein CgeB|nr:glycosyltransferase [Ignavibacteria bacterium]MCU7502190.1 glycosyltransferase [Ignavibacteria bacterium]MCU7517407.1 glycosyltransferase [Ignavibacteria bacterium]
MKSRELQIVILGLSITSAWGNGHATTYRGLVRELARRGHNVLFLERDLPWYASNRDMPQPPFGCTRIYSSLEELKEVYQDEIKKADMVIVGSYVPEGVEVGKWVNLVARNTAFYDIDTPVTLSKLERKDYEYLSPELIPRYRLYLSFTGGPTLMRLEKDFGSPMARALYCSVDPEKYYPENGSIKYDLGYLGTYSNDRQPVLEHLLLQPARLWEEGRFIVAGPQYPESIRWPGNVERVYHLNPSEHRKFYNSQRFTLNVTRADMTKAGYSPSVRLFEAAACSTPIISDYWEGLNTIFTLNEEILISHSPEETLKYLRAFPEETRIKMAEKARERVLHSHTAAQRAEELEGYILEALGSKL